MEFYSLNDTGLECISLYWQTFLFKDKKRDEYDIYPIPGNLGPYNVDKHVFKIRKDKPIILSPINWIAFYEDNKTLEDAKHEIDIIDKTKIDLTLDNNIQLRDHCHRSGIHVFDIGKRRAVTDGYWLVFKPDVGEHHINSFGTCRSGEVNIRVCYNISVY